MQPVMDMPTVHSPHAYDSGWSIGAIHHAWGLTDSPLQYGFPNGATQTTV